MRHSTLGMLLTLTILAVSIPLAAACEAALGDAVADASVEPPTIRHSVAGTGVHYFTTATIHSQTPTATGMVQRSTDLVVLEGDVAGTILYHPVSTFDFAEGTLTNAGHQVFSGTVPGTGPVLLHDDRFQFVVDLGTGATVGKVFLENRLDGPRSVRCTLDVVGTGLTAEGNAEVAYTGECLVASARPVRLTPANP